MISREHELIEQIRELIQAKEFRRAKEILSGVEPVDMAECLGLLPPAELVFFFRLLPKDMAIDVFELLDTDVQQTFLRHASDKEVAVMLEDMSDDDRTELFDELPAKTVKELLRQLSPQERALANRLLGYPQDSAGRIMTPEYIDLKAAATVQEALDRIRQTAPNKETIYTCFVTDPYRHLLGEVDLEDLLLADPDALVGDVMDPAPIWILTTQDQEEAAKVISQYDLYSLPVVDSEERLVGIITFDDVLDVVEEEATEDLELHAGIQPMDEDYLDASVVTLVRKRFTWLVICIFAESLTSAVLRYFEPVISQAVTLTFFVPLLIGTGGNSGTQSATVMVRSITLGTGSWRNAGETILRETGVGVTMGVVLGILGLLRAVSLGVGLPVTLAVGVALAAVVLMGNLVGTLLPLVGHSLGIDPAIMSGPLLTTVVDVCGLMVYFGIAQAFLKVASL
ncbi:magnesium transporter [Jonquetella anthropi]|uniref:magnesium transporter n=1 Tax=Jonquetella anthropi TaxID=428712 RepID=UPI00235310EF|nr:magnesium transporter [Jonquetella anthropi]